MAKALQYSKVYTVDKHNKTLVYTADNPNSYLLWWWWDLSEQSKKKREKHHHVIPFFPFFWRGAQDVKRALSQCKRRISRPHNCRRRLVLLIDQWSRLTRSQKRLPQQRLLQQEMRRVKCWKRQKQATYQSDATTNKVHCSLSSLRDQHSPPWLKLLNAKPVKVLHSRCSRLVNSRNIGKDNPKSMMIWIRRWNDIIIIQGSWFSLLTFRYGRYFIKKKKMSATTQAMRGEVMEKTKQEQMKLRELPGPPRLPPLKSSDHCSPALQWSLFNFNMELRKNGLE